MLSARLRLLSLWVSQAARTAADAALCLFVVLLSVSPGTEAAMTVAALFVLPGILLTPVIGGLCNALPRRQVLLGASGACLVAVALTATFWLSWLWCVGVVAFGTAVYVSARQAMLPAASRDARLPLARINGWFEFGAALMILTSLAGGLEISRMRGADLTEFWPGSKLFPSPLLGAVLFLNIVTALAALPVAFPSDASRREGPGQALAGFFRDARRIVGTRALRGSLLSLALIRGLMLTALAVALLAATLDPDLFKAILLMIAGAACGALLAGMQGYPTRMLGVVPLATSGLTVCFVIAALIAPERSDWLCLLIGIGAGMINVPLLANYQLALPEDARGNGMALLNAAAGLVALAACAGLYFLPISSIQGLLWILAVLSCYATLFAWRFLLRDVVEYATEIISWPFFRIEGHGPGLEAIPRQGPILVVANHSAWFDPVWLAKVLPRHLVPMLTSIFYDIPVLRALVSVAGTIRVEASGYRKDAPELKEAVAALERGAALLIFPEGQMRKAADIPLRPFGRGVWRILQERPDTPVVVCWIEGGWGSFTSYFKGKPTKNKRPDFWRRIQIGVSAPQVIDPAILADHRATRKFLANECLQARKHLGLEPLAMPGLFGVHAHDDEDEGEAADTPVAS